MPETYNHGNIHTSLPQGYGGLGLIPADHKYPNAITQSTQCIESTSKIRDAAGTYEEWLSLGHNTVDSLEKRLDTVLRPVPPVGPGGAPPLSSPTGSHLLNRLQEDNSNFAYLIKRIQDIIDRVEV